MPPGRARIWTAIALWTIALGWVCRLWLLAQELPPTDWQRYHDAMAIVDRDIAANAWSECSRAARKVDALYWRCLEHHELVRVMLLAPFTNATELRLIQLGITDRLSGSQAMGGQHGCHCYTLDLTDLYRLLRAPPAQPWRRISVLLNDPSYAANAEMCERGITPAHGPRWVCDVADAIRGIFP